MKTIYPQKLKLGDEIRVISLSKSLAVVSPENQKIATQALESLGLKVTFGAHVNEVDMMGSSSVQSRLADLHDAFLDENVKGILTVLGGYNCNQLLEYIDYDLIRNNPKVFCGYSDITAVGNAITYMTGLVTYSGLHYSSFAMQKGFDYCLEFFKKALFEISPIELKCSSEWSDDAWYLDQNNRTFHSNYGWKAVNPGEVQGTIVGGNLGTLRLLCGTPYMPSLEDTILFIEEVSAAPGIDVQEFDRDLQALIHMSDFKGVRGMVIGRFEDAFGMTADKLDYMVKSKPELRDIPIIANAGFGHTMPIFTFPIGGKGHMRVSEAGKVTLTIEKH